MTYQPLTKEQYEQARQQFSHEQIMQMENKRKAEQQTAPEPKGPNLAQQIGQSAVGSTLVRPAVRTGQAIGAGLVNTFGNEEQKGRLDEALQQPTTVNMGPLGKMELPPVKAGTQAARQIIGEGLEAASWLYGPAQIKTAAGLSVGRTMMQSGAHLGFHSGLAGGMASGGLALQDEEMGAGEVLGQTAMGVGLGVAGGTMLGTAMPLVPMAGRALAQGSQTATDAVQGLGNRALGALKGTADTGKRVGEGILDVPTRIGSRIAEGMKKSAERQRLMQASPPHIREAMKQGIPDEWVNFVREGIPEDKAIRADMLELAKANTDPRSFRPAPVSRVGQQINEGPVQHLLEVRDTSVAQTKAILDSLPSQPKDVTNIHQQFMQDMQIAGVVEREGTLVALRGSRIPEGDLSFYNQIYKEFAPDASGQTQLTYQQMHQLRQKWFDVAQSNQTFTQGTTSYAQRVRAFLTQEIDEAAGGRYMESQVQTREVLDALGEYARILGYKGNIENITAKDLKAGEVFMRSFGNASDRPLTVLDDLYSTSRKYGYEGQENILAQLRFADMLQDVYGAPSRSLSGQMSRASNASQDPAQVTASSLREMVKWSPYSGAIRLMRNTGLLGRRPEDVMEAFERMILTEGGRTPTPQAAASLREVMREGQEQISETIAPLQQGGNAPVSSSDGNILQRAIQRIKDTPNREGGFMNFGAPSLPKVADYNPRNKSEAYDAAKEVLRQIKDMRKEGNATLRDVQNAERQVEINRKALK